MNKKIIALIVLLMAFSTVVIASAQMVVGVKKGDWIEYTVTTTGTPPDSAHSITAARMEVLDVQGTTIQVNITSTYSNGTQVSSPSTLNLATGQLIDNFIIPAGLTTGSEFNSNMGMGNMVRMKIAGTSQGTCVGATRTVVTATSGGNTYVWDQATGVSVEGTTTEPTYTMHTLATNTNMWTLPSSTESSPDMTLIYVAVIVIVVIVLVAAVAVFAVRSRKKRV